MSAPAYQTKPLSIPDFEQWRDRKAAAGHLYELINGIPTKKEGIKQLEFFIAQFLMRLFAKTKMYAEGAELLAETDVYINDNTLRRPDLAVFSAQQIRDTRFGVKVVPTLAIEILSKSESYEDIDRKIDDYFNAGVQLVWYIAPKSQKIYVYTSPKNIQVFSDADICSAEPIVDMAFCVDDLFKIV